jgi:hypothetical protein
MMHDDWVKVETLRVDVIELPSQFAAGRRLTLTSAKSWQHARERHGAPITALLPPERSRNRESQGTSSRGSSAGRPTSSTRYGYADQRRIPRAPTCGIARNHQAGGFGTPSRCAQSASLTTNCRAEYRHDAVTNPTAAGSRSLGH